MRSILPVIATVLICLTTSAQSAKKVIKKLGNEPAFFIDSISVSRDDLKNYQPEQIASVSVYKQKSAMELLGEEGKDGAVYIETKAFDKKRYWNFFSSKSPEYARAVPDVQADSTVQYILNGKVLNENYEGNLASINDTLFQSITIIGKEELEKQYGITDKMFGVVILSKVPDNLYNGKKKFNG